MTKVGIYCPAWLFASHNTDYRIAKSFATLEDFTEIKTEFVASAAYTISFNINRIAQRIIGDSASLVHHGLQDSEQIDVIYHYGNIVKENNFFKSVGSLPVFVTTGFMTDNYIKDLFGELIDRQKEADQLARELDKAAILHFHTHSGRQRFLSYRPDFEERTVAIPFFLPNLAPTNTSQEVDLLADERINILFVGYHGQRKGLYELIEALDILGGSYLEQHKVRVTVVSKDKPQPKSGFSIDWHDKLPHKQIMQLMHEASIFVLVPKQESYGLVLIEAMAAKCAIITDDDETRQEILGDAGIQIPFGSSSHMVQALRRLIEDNNYRESLGEKANLRAKCMFYPDVVAAQYESYFNKFSIHKDN